MLSPPIEDGRRQPWYSRFLQSANCNAVAVFRRKRDKEPLERVNELDRFGVFRSCTIRTLHECGNSEGKKGLLSRFPLFSPFAPKEFSDDE